MITDQILIIKALTALCVDNQLHKDGAQEITRNLVQNVYQHISDKKFKKDDENTEIVEGMLEVLERAFNQSKDKIHIPTIMQSVYIILKDDPAATRAVDMISDLGEFTDSELQRILLVCCGEVKDTLNRDKLVMEIRLANKALKFGDSSVVEIAENLGERLANFDGRAASVIDRFSVKSATGGDVEALAGILGSALDDYAGLGGMKSGWQALNRMMGSAGSFRMGMFVLVGALTHCYKSGFVHDLGRHFFTMNDPVTEDPEKTAMGMMISVENRAEEDSLRMFQALKEQETGKPMSKEEAMATDPLEAATYVDEKLRARGWNYYIGQLNPDEFTYVHLRDMIRQFEDQGNEIKFIIFDYLALIDKSGFDNSMQGEAIRQLMQKVRIFTSARGILFITPHQLSQEAMAINRSGVDDLLSELAGKNYWDGSKRIANEVDLEIYLNRTVKEGVSYLWCRRGKHRGVKHTAEINKSFILPFTGDNYSTIAHDVDKEDSSIKTIQSGLASAGFTF